MRTRTMLSTSFVIVFMASSHARAEGANGPGKGTLLAEADQPPDQPPPKPTPEEKPPVKTEPAPSGWTGDHFVLQTPGGTFTLQPYGYVQSDYRIYAKGDGVPPNTFTIRRARLGFQGKLDRYYEFAFLGDFADTTSTLLRDAFVNISYIREFQLTIGQFVEPFGQEVASIGVANIDFVERGLTSLLYPSASGSFRSPGAMVHGDIASGTVSYWVGVFNGKGPLAANTTSEPEVIARLRIYPFISASNALSGIAIGGAYGHGRTRGLSNELSFNGFVPDRAFAFFPQLPVNGPVERYNGEATFLLGPFAARGEYDELHQLRRGLDVGFGNLPQVLARGFNIDATFLLTGERRPENGQPKATNPFLRPDGTLGLGAWELKARYSYLWAKAVGDPTTGFPTTRPASTRSLRASTGTPPA
jgi:phosphate-selective porin OprO and OprP